MRRLVTLAVAALIGGCGGVLDRSGAPADSPLLPRAAFGAGTPTSVAESPAHYTGESLGMSAERLATRVGDAFYLAYRLNGPDASLVLVVADRESGVTARPSAFSRGAETTTYRRFAANSGAFQHTTFATDRTRCLWFERTGVDDPAIWGAYCVGAAAPPPAAIRNKILRAVEVRALVAGAPPLGSDDSPEVADDDFDVAPPELDGDADAETTRPADVVGEPELTPPEDAFPAPRPPSSEEPVFFSVSEEAPSRDAPAADDAATE